MDQLPKYAAEWKILTQLEQDLCTQNNEVYRLIKETVAEAPNDTATVIGKGRTLRCLFERRLADLQTVVEGLSTIQKQKRTFIAQFKERTIQWCDSESSRLEFDSQQSDNSEETATQTAPTEQHAAGTIPQRGTAPQNDITSGEATGENGSELVRDTATDDRQSRSPAHSTADCGPEDGSGSPVSNRMPNVTSDLPAAKSRVIQFSQVYVGGQAQHRIVTRPYDTQNYLIFTCDGPSPACLESRVFNYGSDQNLKQAVKDHAREAHGMTGGWKEICNKMGYTVMGCTDEDVCRNNRAFDAAAGRSTQADTVRQIRRGQARRTQRLRGHGNLSNELSSRLPDSQIQQPWEQCTPQPAATQTLQMSDGSEAEPCTDNSTPPAQESGPRLLVTFTMPQRAVADEASLHVKERLAGNGSLNGNYSDFCFSPKIETGQQAPVADMSPSDMDRTRGQHFDYLYQ